MQEFLSHEDFEKNQPYVRCEDFCFKPLSGAHPENIYEPLSSDADSYCADTMESFCNSNLPQQCKHVPKKYDVFRSNIPLEYPLLCGTSQTQVSMPNDAYADFSSNFSDAVTRSYPTRPFDFQSPPCNVKLCTKNCFSRTAKAAMKTDLCVNTDRGDSSTFNDYCLRSKLTKNEFYSEQHHTNSQKAPLNDNFTFLCDDGIDAKQSGMPVKNGYQKKRYKKRKVKDKIDDLYNYKKYKENLAKLNVALKSKAMDFNSNTNTQTDLDYKTGKNSHINDTPEKYNEKEPQAELPEIKSRIENGPKVNYDTARGINVKLDACFLDKVKESDHVLQVNPYICILDEQTPEKSCEIAAKEPKYVANTQRLTKATDALTQKIANSDDIYTLQVTTLGDTTPSAEKCQNNAHIQQEVKTDDSMVQQLPPALHSKESLEVKYQGETQIQQEPKTDGALVEKQIILHNKDSLEVKCQHDAQTQQESKQKDRSPKQNDLVLPDTYSDDLDEFYGDDYEERQDHYKQQYMFEHCYYDQKEMLNFLQKRNESQLRDHEYIQSTKDVNVLTSELFHPKLGTVKVPPNIFVNSKTIKKENIFFETQKLVYFKNEPKNMKSLEKPKILCVKKIENKMKATKKDRKSKIANTNFADKSIGVRKFKSEDNPKQPPRDNYIQSFIDNPVTHSTAHIQDIEKATNTANNNFTDNKSEDTKKVNMFFDTNENDFYCDPNYYDKILENENHKHTNASHHKQTNVSHLDCKSADLCSDRTFNDENCNASSNSNPESKISAAFKSADTKYGTSEFCSNSKFYSADSNFGRSIFFDDLSSENLNENVLKNLTNKNVLKEIEINCYKKKSFKKDFESVKKLTKKNTKKNNGYKNVKIKFSNKLFFNLNEVKIEPGKRLKFGEYKNENMEKIENNLIEKKCVEKKSNEKKKKEEIVVTKFLKRINLSNDFIYNLK